MTLEQIELQDKNGTVRMSKYVNIPTTMLVKIYDSSFLEWRINFL